MSETIAKRVGRIISGSLNALVNALENRTPQIVMQEAIREIDLALDEVQTELGKVIAAKHLANKRLAEKNNAFETLSHNIEYALSANRDDLAKAAISHQLDIEAQIPVLEHTIHDYVEQGKKLDGYIAALLAKRREMNEELKQFLASQQHSSSAIPATHSESFSNQNVDRKVRDATTVFDRMLEQQTGLSNSSNSHKPLSVDLTELEKLAHHNRIEERLKTLKTMQKK